LSLFCLEYYHDNSMIASVLIMGVALAVEIGSAHTTKTGALKIDALARFSGRCYLSDTRSGCDCNCVVTQWSQDNDEFQDASTCATSTPNRPVIKQITSWQQTVDKEMCSDECAYENTCAFWEVQYTEQNGAYEATFCRLLANEANGEKVGNFHTGSRQAACVEGSHVCDEGQSTKYFPRTSNTTHEHFHSSRQDCAQRCADNSTCEFWVFHGGNNKWNNLCELHQCDNGGMSSNRRGGDHVTNKFLGHRDCGCGSSTTNCFSVTMPNACNATVSAMVEDSIEEASTPPFSAKVADQGVASAKDVRSVRDTAAPTRATAGCENGEDCLGEANHAARLSSVLPSDARPSSGNDDHIAIEAKEP